MSSKMNLSLLRDKRTHYAWLLVVLAWACFRAVALNKFFGAHNIHAWTYLVVDLLSSIPYAIYSSKSTVNFLDKDWQRFRKNVLVTAISFYIPDLYVNVFARTVPKSLYLGFAFSICIFSGLAFLSVRRDISKINKEILE
jgi:hypothetical protein